MSQRWTSGHLLLLQPRASFRGLQSFLPLLSALHFFDTALDRAGPSCSRSLVARSLPCSRLPRPRSSLPGRPLPPPLSPRSRAAAGLVGSVTQRLAA